MPLDGDKARYAISPPLLEEARARAIFAGRRFGFAASDITAGRALIIFRGLLAALYYLVYSPLRRAGAHGTAAARLPGARCKMAALFER